MSILPRIAGSEVTRLYQKPATEKIDKKAATLFSDKFYILIDVSLFLITVNWLKELCSQLLNKQD